MEEEKEIPVKKPNRRNKFNARFPPNRIKKIIQVDEEIGKMTAAVPVLIGRSVELFAEKLLLKAAEITAARQAKTLAPQHLKMAVSMDPLFHFLAPIVAKVPDLEGPSTPGIGCGTSPFLSRPSVSDSTTTGKKRGRPPLNKAVAVGEPETPKKRKRRTKSTRAKRFNDDSEDDGDFVDSLLEEEVSPHTGQLSSHGTNGTARLLSQSSRSSTTGISLETSSDIPSSSTTTSGGSGSGTANKKFDFEFPVTSPLVKTELTELPTTPKLVE